MDSDHRLLLRCSKPLLQSRNSGVSVLIFDIHNRRPLQQIPICSELLMYFFFLKVVMAVAQLYYYVAPRSEIHIVAKSLIRLLRHHR